MQFLLFISFIVNVCCSPAFILKKSIVSEPSMLLPAAAHRKQSEKKKMADEAGLTNMDKVTELLHGHFHFKVLPEGAVDRAKVICKHCNVELSYHQPVIRSYDCTVPIKVRYMLLLNALLDFAYNNTINRD